MLMLFAAANAVAQQSAVVEYGYNARGELNLIISGADTLMNFYDASGNRITKSQNIYAIPDEQDPRGDQFLRCFPNPAGEGVTVSFDMKDPADYTLTMYDQNGKFLRTVATGKSLSGRTEVSFSLSPYPQGMYFIWFESKGISKVKKIIRR